MGSKKRNKFRKSRKKKAFAGSAWYELRKSQPRQEMQGSVERNQNEEREAMKQQQPDSACNYAGASTSRRKMELRGYESESGSDEDDFLDNSDFEGHGYRLVDLSSLSISMSEVHKCGRGKLNLKENLASKAGLRAELHVECTKCKKITPLNSSTSVTQRGTSWDVNRRAVYHSIETGGGYEGLASFCGIMNMPCMTKTAYYKQLENVIEAVEAEAEEEMRKAGQQLRETIVKETGADENDILDVAVSFDGTWAKRGFTSQTGVVFVISIDTGEVLDSYVLSKYCSKCSMKKKQCGSDIKAFEDWRVEHEMTGNCDINFSGSSPAMEASGAVTVWSRSIEKHNMRYKWMVSDGDSKAFNAVQNIYEDCVVEKLDCVGHVQKRMGKHLLNLKAKTKGKLSDGKPIGGQGRLTETRIKDIQRMYGLAIRQNTISKVSPTEKEIDVAVYTIRKNIIALLNHNVKNADRAKQHRFCPQGDKSWCKWQKDKALCSNTYSGENCLPEVFLEILKPVFMTLSETELLKRCVLGTTQNANECLNSLVWVRCPKHKYHGYKTIRCAVASAVCHFHSGAASRERVMERLGVLAGVHSKQAWLKRDRKRVRNSDLEATEKAKKRRQVEQHLRTQKEEALRTAEGVTYEAGAF